MAVVFYDLGTGTNANDPDWIDIDRIYCFDEDAFSDADGQHLEGIYRSLPEFITAAGIHFGRWFSDQNNAENGYLWASMEPPGLQVAGTLPRAKWEAWHRLFQERIAGLPFRTLE